MNTLLGIAGGLGAGLCWATTSVLVRTLSGTISPGSLNALRSLTGGGLLLGVCVLRGEAGDILATPLWAVVSLWAAIVLGQVIGDTFFFRSIGYLGVTSALTIGISSPIITALAGVFLFSEVARISQGIGIGLVIFGVFWIIHEGADCRRHPLVGGTFKPGAHLGGLAALTWAGSALLLKAPVGIMSALAAAALRLPVGGLMLLLTPWTRGARREVTRGLRTETLRMTAICLLGAVGPWSYTLGIKHGGVALGSTLSATAPLFSVLMELLCFGKWPSRRTIIGAVVTVLGILVLRIP